MRRVLVIMLLSLSVTLVSCAPASESGGSSDAGQSTESVSQEQAASHPAFELEVDGRYADEHPAPYSWVDDYSLIAHGMGGLGENRVTNCFEAFEANYDAGYRIFEVDLVFTSDGALVARHDWEPYMYAFLGQNVEDAEHVMSLEEFEALPIHEDNTPLTMEQVVQLLRVYPDIWIVTDSKSAERAEVRAAMEAIVSAMGPDDVLAERIIIQIYDEPMLDYVREVHDFPNIVYTLYQISGAKEDAVRFAASKGIEVVTFPESMWDADFMALLAAEGVHGAVHTINDPAQAQTYRDSGVVLLYSDFLTP